MTLYILIWTFILPVPIPLFCFCDWKNKYNWHGWSSSSSLLHFSNQQHQGAMSNWPLSDAKMFMSFLIKRQLQIFVWTHMPTDWHYIEIKLQCNNIKSINDRRQHHLQMFVWKWSCHHYWYEKTVENASTVIRKDGNLPITPNLTFFHIDATFQNYLK